MTLIFIIEDNENIADSLAYFIRYLARYDTLIANSAELALDTLMKVSTPDLILLDINMPVMDGFLFADEFNRDMTHARIPVVALTSFVESPLDQPVPFEVTEWVSKPVKFKDLIALVNKYLKNSGKQTL